MVCIMYHVAGVAEKERVAFTDKDTPEVAQLKLDLLRIAALTGRYDIRMMTVNEVSPATAVKRTKLG